MQLFKLKKLKKNLEEETKKSEQTGPLIFGVIDASGSMEPGWTKVANTWNNVITNFKNVRTITFSREAKILEPKTKLNLDIRVHDGDVQQISWLQ